MEVVIIRVERLSSMMSVRLEAIDLDPPLRRDRCLLLDSSQHTTRCSLIGTHPLSVARKAEILHPILL